jgi:hypothetical protein
VGGVVDPPLATVSAAPDPLVNRCHVAFLSLSPYVVLAGIVWVDAMGGIGNFRTITRDELRARIDRLGLSYVEAASASALPKTGCTSRCAARGGSAGRRRLFLAISRRGNRDGLRSELRCGGGDA